MQHYHTFVPRACEKCGSEFQARTDSIKAGYGRFCSHSCASNRPHKPPSVPEIQPNGTARLPLYSQNGSVTAHAVIDAADVDLVGLHRWHCSLGYAVRSVHVVGRRRVVVKLHRVILGLTHGDGMDGDHINRDRLDCRRANLRAIPDGLNGQNVPRQRRSSSQFRGVRFRPKAKHKQWQATVTANGKRVSLGYFVDEEEAGRVAQEARLRMQQYAVD